MIVFLLIGFIPLTVLCSQIHHNSIQIDQREVLNKRLYADEYGLLLVNFHTFYQQEHLLLQKDEIQLFDQLQNKVKSDKYHKALEQLIEQEKHSAR